MLKPKYISMLILLLASALCFIRYIKNDDKRQDLVASEKVKAKKLSQISIDNSQEKTQSKVCTEQYRNKNELLDIDVEFAFQTDEVEKYLRSLGYFELNGISNANVSVDTEYSNFSDEDLQRLAEANDGKALLTLILRSQTAANHEATYNYAYKAATLGYTSPFMALASSSMAKSILARKDGDNQAAIDFYLEGAAWQNMVKYRYDPMHLMFSEIANYTAIYKRDLVIDDLEEKIELKTAELFERLKKDRMDMGLGSFENIVPEIFKKQVCK